MRRETARRLMMEKLYETISPADAARLEAHLLVDANAAREWEDARQMRGLLAAMSDPTPPARAEEFIQQAARSLEAEAPPVHSRRFWNYAVAAAILMTATLPFVLQGDKSAVKRDDSTRSFNLEQNARSRRDALDSSVNRLALSPKRNIQESQFAYIASATVEPAEEKAVKMEMALAYDKQSNVAAMPAAPVKANAEELFRTGLTLYNAAFAKVGEERNAMLKSAIIFLRDLEQRCPDQRSWIALSSILIADSHRALGENDSAIEVYQRMIESFPELEKYVRQARISIVNLLLNDDKKLSQAEAALRQFNDLYPHSPEFAEAALTLAEKLQAVQPERSLAWCRSVAEDAGEENRLQTKAARLAAAVDEKLRDKYYVKDWWMLGPLEQNYLPKSLTPDRFYNVKKGRFPGLNGKPVQWQRPYANQNGDVDFAEAFGAAREGASAFAMTSIYSPEAEFVLLTFGGNGGLRIWLNEDAIWSNQQTQPFHRDAQSVSCSLRKGWNTLLVKSYLTGLNPEWKFSLRILDRNGFTMPDLTIDPERKAIGRENDNNEESNLLRAGSTPRQEK
ncbi:MAG: tetratricopeptide repeat protein [Candidatus Omnitrophota bacterium]